MCLTKEEHLIRSVVSHSMIEFVTGRVSGRYLEELHDEWDKDSFGTVAWDKSEHS